MPVFLRKETTNQPSLSSQLPAIITKTNIIKAAAPPPPPPPPPRMPPPPAPQVSIEPMRSSPVNQKEFHPASRSGPSKQAEGGSSPSILPPVGELKRFLLVSEKNGVVSCAVPYLQYTNGFMLEVWLDREGRFLYWFVLPDFGSGNKHHSKFLTITVQ